MNEGCVFGTTNPQASDGRCNRNIAANTAIATFDSNGNYYAGHAAVFISCQDDYTILVGIQRYVTLFKIVTQHLLIN